MNALPITMAIALLGIAAPMPPVKLLPVDEAPKSPSFLHFRNDLLALIQKRDCNGLLKLIHEDTHIDFGGSRGSSDFIEQWHPEAPDSKVWKELETILRMGGAFNPDGRFEAPYISARWPEKFDAFEYSAITAKNVPCYPTPDSKSKPIRILAFDIVRTSVDDSNFDEFKKLDRIGWRKIELLDGKIGYVRSINVRNGVDQRIYFSKGPDGKWFISAFIAGD